MIQTATPAPKRRGPRPPGPPAVAGALIAAFYLLDALMDALLFGERSVAGQIFAPTVHELAIRLLASLVLTLFLLYAAPVFRHRERLAASLEDALRHLQVERTRFDALADAIGEGILILDRDYRILYHNERFREIVGHDCTGQRCHAAYGGNAGVCGDCPMERTFADGRVHLHERRIDGPGGTERHIGVTASPLRGDDGAIVAGVEVVRDITERKAAEAQIAALNGDLTRRAEAMEAFSYSLSHDLRNVLTRISSSAQVLRDGLADDGEESRRFAEHICAGSDQMAALVDSMLLLARIDRSELRREPVSLSELARLCLAEQRAGEPQRQVEAAIDGELTVSGDWQLLRVAMTNLVGNAWKYSAHEALTRIAFTATEADGVVAFALSDNGAGFDMAESERLFTPFQRLHDAADFPGSGIGLATVQRIVERHGGRVWAEGAPGRGATFYFTLPGGTQVP